jgi:1,4-alpha-glucan branching enzyme
MVKSILAECLVMNGKSLQIYDFYMLYVYIQEQNYCLWDEFGQSAEWNFEGSLDWHLNEYPYHDGVRKLITDLNGLYKAEPALYENNLVPSSNGLTIQTIKIFLLFEKESS